MCFDSKFVVPKHTSDGLLHQKRSLQHFRRGRRGYQEGGHVVLPEGGQQRLEDIQDVAPVRAQLSCVGPSYKRQAMIQARLCLQPGRCSTSRWTQKNVDWKVSQQ